MEIKDEWIDTGADAAYEVLSGGGDISTKHYSSIIIHAVAPLIAADARRAALEEVIDVLKVQRGALRAPMCMPTDWKNGYGSAVVYQNLQDVIAIRALIDAPEKTND